MFNLELLRVKPIAQEPVKSAWDIWCGGALPADGSDGQVALGPLADLSILAADDAESDNATDDYAAAYRVWANGRLPRAQCEREMAAPSHLELYGGPHTCYRLPPKDGQAVEMIRGRLQIRPNT